MLSLVAFVGMGCAAPLEFEVQGDQAVMTGELDSRSVGKVRELLTQNPDLKRVVLLDVPGSVDDVAALEAARLIRQAGLNTLVPRDGEIASGGVDFFLAGVERAVAPGGRVGVHSWSEGKVEGADLSRDDPEHRLYLDYLGEMGIPEDFYWFTLQAANSRDIHWMSREELLRYQLTTKESD
ncbi:MAG: hypothetical protein MK135_07525 [Polyangiaceae bacterium]|nr:hypothetical protein [Polyangiaceae bacterium]